MEDDELMKKSEELDRELKDVERCIGILDIDGILDSQCRGKEITESCDSVKVDMSSLDELHLDENAPEVNERLLKAKIKSLLIQVQELTSQKDRAESAVIELKSELKALQGNKIRKGNPPSERQRRLEVELECLKGENQDLKKEIDGLQAIVKESESKSRVRESRLKQTLKSIQTLKEQLLDKKNEKNESNSQIQREVVELKTQNKTLEKKNSDLLNCCKKQMQLIDVLKKQKIHLEASRLLDFTEQEFVSALDWKLEQKEKTG